MRASVCMGRGRFDCALPPSDCQLVAIRFFAAP